MIPDLWQSDSNLQFSCLPSQCNDVSDVAVAHGRMREPPAHPCAFQSLISALHIYNPSPERDNFRGWSHAWSTVTVSAEKEDER